VDIIAYGVAGEFDSYEVIRSYIARLDGELDDAAVKSIRRRMEREINIDQKSVSEFEDFINAHGFSNNIFRLSHHQCHGIGALAYSPFDEALIFTSDGRGDFESLTITDYIYSGKKVLHRELTVDSIGYFYSMVTVLLGYKAYRHEGKVTGLAAHGDPEKCMPLMRKMIDFENGQIRSRCGEFYNPSMDELGDLSEAVKDEFANYSKEDIAAAAQKHLEFMVCSVLSRYLDRSNPKNVCLSGGTFGNVLLNQKIAELEGVNKVYVLPFMGDGGQSACAAGAAYLQLFSRKPIMRTLFLGPSVCEEQPLDSCLTQLSSHELECVDLGDIVPSVIECLQANKVIAMVKGRMEFGPRALCNRSIIYHANDLSMNHWLNERLNRTEFMPFAPITPANLAPSCYPSWHADDANSPNMTITFGCSDEMKAKCPAAVHIDGTARPQVITEDRDEIMFRVLNAWHEATGEPSLINTSYNRHEEPIVCNIDEALSPLIDGIVEAVFVDGRYMVTRRIN
jgi:carbamoyltransferase